MSKVGDLGPIIENTYHWYKFLQAKKFTNKLLILSITPTVNQI